MNAAAILAVGVGAALGGIARYLIGIAFIQRFGPGFPWGTLFINVTGSFLIGILAELAATRAFGVTPLVRIFVATGVLGGYTTFSTFSLDNLALLGSGEGLLAGAYTIGSVGFGLVAAYLGQLVTRLAVG